MAKGKVLLGAAIAAAVGVAAGMLTAPKSGKETRADLKRKAGDLKHKASDKAATLRDKAARTAQDVAETVKEKKGGFFK